MSEYKDDFLAKLDARYAERKRISLCKARNKNVAEQLLAEILRWSSRQKSFGSNAGHWVVNMEFICWQRQPKLRKMALIAGGWWRYCDGKVFTPYKQWVKLFSTWQKIETAFIELRKSEKVFEHLLSQINGKLNDI